MDGSLTSATVTGLSNGETYTFSVIATNSAGASEPGQPSGPVTPFPTPSPSSPPTNVVATAGNGNATVGWVRPLDDRDLSIRQYIVTASPGGATDTVPGDTTSMIFENLEYNTTYTFTVVATNVEGASQPSEPSNAVMVFLDRDVARSQADAYMTGSMDSFQDGKFQQPRPFNWSDDGCSVIYDMEFGLACHRHDFGYRNYGNGLRLSRTPETREWIDDIFLEDAYAECLEKEGGVLCEERARTIHAGLRTLPQSKDAFYGDE